MERDSVILSEVNEVAGRKTHSLESLRGVVDGIDVFLSGMSRRSLLEISGGRPEMPSVATWMISQYHPVGRRGHASAGSSPQQTAHQWLTM